MTGVEAVAVENTGTFALGKWRPEYKIMENPLSRSLFAAFGAACRAYAAKSGHTPCE